MLAPQIGCRRSAPRFRKISYIIYIISYIILYNINHLLLVTKISRVQGLSNHDQADQISWGPQQLPPSFFCFTRSINKFQVRLKLFGKLFKIRWSMSRATKNDRSVRNRKFQAAYFSYFDFFFRFFKNKIKNISKNSISNQTK